MKWQSFLSIVSGNTKWNSRLEEDLANLTIWFSMLQNIYPAELKTYVHAMNCTGMFIAALFIINKTGGKNQMSFTGWWINKLRSIQAMEYYLVLKWNELASHEKTGGNLKCVLLSERSQSERAMFCMISTVWHSGKSKTMETAKRSVVSGFEGEGGMNRWSAEDF